jgi:hypothetical protein
MRFALVGLEGKPGADPVEPIAFSEALRLSNGVGQTRIDSP